MTLLKVDTLSTVDNAMYARVSTVKRVCCTRQESHLSVLSKLPGQTAALSNVEAFALCGPR